MRRARHRQPPDRDAATFESGLGREEAGATPFEAWQQINASPLICVASDIRGPEDKKRKPEVPNQRPFGKFQIPHQQVEVAAPLQILDPVLLVPQNDAVRHVAQTRGEGFRGRLHCR